MEESWTNFVVGLMFALTITTARRAVLVDVDVDVDVDVGRGQTSPSVSFLLPQLMHFGWLLH